MYKNATNSKVQYELLKKLIVRERGQISQEKYISIKTCMEINPQD